MINITTIVPHYILPVSVIDLSNALIGRPSSRMIQIERMLSVRSVSTSRNLSALFAYDELPGRLDTV